MRARVTAGWLCVGPYADDEMAPIRINVQGHTPAKAFLDWDLDTGERVVKVRKPAGVSGAVSVSVTVGDATTDVGRVVL